ncbi:MAG: hypothetical protein LBR53_02440 [Deltaproteobacteria bacterium]|nr:hypothetical protein [Deltaproteobacteria bacterium]
MLKTISALLTSVFLSAAFFGCGDSKNPLIGGEWKLDVDASKELMRWAIETEDLTTTAEQDAFRDLMKTTTLNYKPNTYSLNAMGTVIEEGKITYSGIFGLSWKVCYIPDRKYEEESYCETCEILEKDYMECADENDVKSFWKRNPT